MVRGIRICKSQWTRRRCRNPNVLANQLGFILFFVHSGDVLLEVVETWPDFASVTTVLRSTLVRAETNAYAMNALLVARKVIDGGEAFA